jgi:hypothetical protein
MKIVIIAPEKIAMHKIQKLAEELEKEINKSLLEFHKLGKIASSLEKQLQANYENMYTIIKQLRPVEAMVRSQQKEDMNKLFDLLIHMFEREKNDTL